MTLLFDFLSSLVFLVFILCIMFPDVREKVGQLIDALTVRIKGK